MPKRKIAETQLEQSTRFKREAQKLINAGELNTTEGEDGLNFLVGQIRVKHREKDTGA